MTTNIVNVTVSQQVAPPPSTLQKTGVILSQGGTILAPGTQELLEQPSDLTPLIPNAITVTNAVWSAGVVTLTLASNHGINVGDTALWAISGFTPAGYNATVTVTATGPATLTYPVMPAPGTATTFGIATPEDVGELMAAVTTFFNQGAYRSVYVLELGEGNASDGVAALNAYLTANPNSAYAYLVPRYWDADQDYLNFLAQFQAPTAKTYFFTTTTLASYQSYTSLMKCVLAFIESPQYGVWSQNVITAIATDGNGNVTATTTSAHGVNVGDWFQVQGVTPTFFNGYAEALEGTSNTTLIYKLAPGYPTLPANGETGTGGKLVASYQESESVPSTEFTAASAFWKAISYDPSDTNRVPPYCYSFVYGVTPFPTFGNGALLAALKAVGINIIKTGAEGGISNTMIVPGTTMDNRKYNYWYATDWAQITSVIRLAAAIENGSNTPLNPLYYNQRGINRLQSVLAGTMDDGASFGLILFTSVQTSLDGDDLASALDAGTYNGYTVVNAVPFIPYCQENPSDYSAGVYKGLSSQFTPQLGFDNILLNIVVSDFVASGSQ